MKGREHHDCVEIIAVKKPSNCCDTELQGFEALVRAGGEVTSSGLRERINGAEALVFATDHLLNGIAALKKPNLNYKTNVFRKAQATVSADEFPLELGWVFVMPSSRGKGLSHKLVDAALGGANGRSVFATSRSNNKPMHRALEAHGFFRHGQPYASQRGDQKLVLFILNAHVTRQG